MEIVIPLVLLFFGWFLFRILKDGWAFFSQAFSLNRFSIDAHDKLLYQNHLEKLPYYQKLTDAGKSKFLERVLYFMHSRYFIGRKGLTMTDEMKVLISASAVQLTFGLQDYKLSNIKRICVYEQPFYSKRSNLRYKGATTKTMILLSWKDFREGYLNSTDKINLGLHEMAHALKLTLYDGQGFDIDFASYLDNWKEIAAEEFSKMQDNKGPYLRDYAKTNQHEFFAVCVEHFFEDPKTFSQQLPDVYNHLCILLNQDPANEKADYQLSKSFKTKVNRNPSFVPVPEKIMRSYQHSNWHWTLSLVLPGFFICLPILFWLKYHTVISGEKLFLYVLGFGVVSLFQWSYFSQRKIAGKKLFFLYAFFGSGPCLTVLFLSLNYILPVTSPVVEQYEIRQKDKYKLSNDEWAYILQLENGAYHNEEGVRSIHAYAAPDEILNSEMIHMTFRHGIFGLKTLRDYQLYRRRKKE